MPSLSIALTIAGSDSGGGAGIQADLKTFHQFGVYGTSVVTAITAQNTQGVRAVQPVAPEVVAAQVAAVAEDLPPDALKTGMLATSALVRQIAESIAGYRLGPYVLDPVMVATSGDRLLDRDAEDAMRSRLVPLAALVTPNLEEAAILTGFEVSDPGSMERAGRRLVDMGAGAALIKGGHLPGDEIVDLLIDAGGVRRYPHRKIATSSTHGTGCTLSAAIVAGLARRNGGQADRRTADPDALRDSVSDALAYLQRAIAHAPGLGRGRGPVSHWG